MFYGWGKKSSDWAMPDGRTLICSYSYVSLMFIFKFVWSRKWHLIGRDRAMDIETNRQDLERMYGAGNVPDIGIFERFGMFITGGVFVALMLASAGFQSIFSSGDGGTIETASLTGDPVAVVIDQDEDPADALGSPGSDAAIGSEVVDPDRDSDADSNSAAESGSAEENANVSTDTGADSGTESDADSAAAVTGDSADDAAGTNAAGSGKLAATDTGQTDSSTGGSETAASASIYQVAPAEFPLGGQGLVSTNAGNPTQGWSEMEVHGAFATTTLDEQEAGPGEKFLVIDYQLLGTEGTANVQNSAFRLDVDGLLYSPTLSFINEVISAGEVFNEVVIFTVPSNLTEFRLEAGAPDPLGDGYQAAWAMYLESAPVPTPAERFTGPGKVGTSRILTTDEKFSSNLASTQQDPLAIEVVKATEAAKIGPDAASPGFKFITVDVQLTGTGGTANLLRGGFRMLAEGELYPTLTWINDTLSAGEVWQGSLVFHVPADATVVDLEAGAPEGWSDGDRALFEISFE